MLGELLKSLALHVVDPARVTVFVGVDDDDQTTRTEFDALRAAAGRLDLRLQARPRPGSVHDVYNRLVADGSGTIIATFTDDVAVATPGWDTAIERSFAPFADGFAVGSLVDALAPGAGTLMAAPRHMVQETGYLLTDWFPFWWGDVWLDEIGALIGRRIVIPVEVVSLWDERGKGKTLRMQNVAFWAAVYEMTRPERLATAERLLHKIHGPDEQARRAAMGQWESIVARFRKANEVLLNPINAMQLEINWTAETRNLGAEANAIERLRNLLGGPAGSG